MTARQIYEYALIELNKVKAPNILLHDFNYFLNKAINQFVNKRYNLYDTNQQTTDDLRVLKATTMIPLNPVDLNPDAAGLLYGKVSQVDFPDNYLHLLNCICEFVVNSKKAKCPEDEKIVHSKAQRLTADMYGEIINNYYQKPSYKRPYYYINHFNTEGKEIPNTNVLEPSGNINLKQDGRGTDFLDLSTLRQSERKAQVRYGNSSNVRCEIRYGNDDSIRLKCIYIDYLKVPQYVEITADQLDLVEDTTQIMEFPDYVCMEIINELVHIIMEHASDPRLQSHLPITQSIASPTQQ